MCPPAIGLGSAGPAPLRSTNELWALSALSTRQYQQLRVANLLMAAALRLVTACVHSGLFALLEHPALDLNRSNILGNTALHCAAYSDNAEAVRMLLADPRLNTANQKNVDNKTPVMIAMDYMNVLRELVAHPSVDLSEELVAR